MSAWLGPFLSFQKLESELLHYVVPWLMADLKVAPVRSVDASDALTPWSEEHAAMATTTERMLRMNMVMERREGGSEGGVE